MVKPYKFVPSGTSGIRLACRSQVPPGVLVRSPTENMTQDDDEVRNEDEELRSLYRTLSDIIPACRDKPVTQVDIVLAAADYIKQLHSTLGEKLAQEVARSLTSKEFLPALSLAHQKVLELFEF